MAHRSSSGGYPWSIEGSSSTIVYIKNTTDTAQDFVMQYDYAGGVYAMGRKTVAAHQTTVIDVRALRDGQVPDTFGKMIPLDVVRGQVRWTMKGREDKVLIGRAEQVDIIEGISSSYACRFCCPNKFYDGFITPEEATLFVDESTQFTSWQRDIDCYGHIWSPFNVSYLTTWSSSDSEIADGGYQGWMTAYSGGIAMVRASWMADSFFADIGSERCDPELVEAVAEAFLNVLGVRFIDVTDGVFTAQFSTIGIGTPTATLNNVDCSGARFDLRVSFDPIPPDAEPCFMDARSFVSLGQDNQFEFVRNPVTGRNFQFFCNVAPSEFPAAIISLRRRSDRGGTSNRIGITVSGPRSGNSQGSTYRGNAGVRLVCQ